LLLGCCALAPGAADAAIRSARVAWLPSPSPGIAGYNVYVREVGDTYGAPVDAGLPASSTSPLMNRLLSGLEDTREYVFAVTGSPADGPEPARPTEARLPARPPPPASCDDTPPIPAAGGPFPGTTAGPGTESGTCGDSVAAPERVFTWRPQTSGTA